MGRSSPQPFGAMVAATIDNRRDDLPVYTLPVIVTVTIASWCSIKHVFVAATIAPGRVYAL